jgi:hypothetical protein
MWVAIQIQLSESISTLIVSQSEEQIMSRKELNGEQRHRDASNRWC